MPFYLRKSVSAGPFRFNFSKGGVGVSIGVKGLRIGSGPRGHYIHAGRGGLYYRATLGRAGARPADAPSLQERPPDIRDYVDSGVEMIDIESANVLAMTDEPFSALLNELNAKMQSTRMAALLGWAGAIFAMVVILGAGIAWFPILALAGLGYAVGAWLDSYQRCAVLFYDLDEHAAARYEALTAAFDLLRSCGAKWHVSAGGQVRDLTTWKRNAGASTLLDRKPTALTYALPTIVRSNVTPPAMAVGRQTLYFLPDVLLVAEGSAIGAVSYDTMQLHWQPSNFIEEEAVPPDARILYHTWKHPNRSGGPDRRFANNRQIPVCEYETMYLVSPNGLNELMQFSRPGGSEALAAAIRGLGYARQAADPVPALAPSRRGGGSLQAARHGSR